MGQLQSVGLDGVGALDFRTTLFIEVRQSEEQSKKSGADFWIARIRSRQVCGPCCVQSNRGDVMKELPSISSITDFVSASAWPSLGWTSSGSGVMQCTGALDQGIWRAEAAPHRSCGTLL